MRARLCPSVSQHVSSCKRERGTPFAGRDHSQRARSLPSAHLAGAVRGFATATYDIKTVGVIGSGLMGHGIAQTAAQAKCVGSGHKGAVLAGRGVQ